MCRRGDLPCLGQVLLQPGAPAAVAAGGQTPFSTLDLGASSTRLRLRGIGGGLRVIRSGLQRVGFGLSRCALASGLIAGQGLMRAVERLSDPCLLCCRRAQLAGVLPTQTIASVDTALEAPDGLLLLTDGLRQFPAKLWQDIGLRFSPLHIGFTPGLRQGLIEFAEPASLGASSGE